jgi:hypothetical protein
MLRKWLQRITATDVVVWGIGLVILVAVVWGSLITPWPVPPPLPTPFRGKYTWEQWADLIIRGPRPGVASTP